MQKFKKFIKKPVVYISFLVLMIIIFITKKVSYLAAEPVGEKDCPPLNPGEDASKTTVTAVNSADGLLPWEQRGGTINDASCLDETTVYGIVQVTSEQDILKALKFAEEKNLKVSIAGVKHSMGGHAFSKNNLVLNMLGFKHVTVNEQEKTMTVQSGATWHDIQKILHPKFAVKAMQSTDIFSVGGSISVNAHGMDHNVGSLGKTIRSMRIMLPDGTIKTASRTENTELFNLVIGGYGLFGIVLDAKIDITPNVVYESERKIIDYKDFPEVFKTTISTDKNIELFYGHLSTSPGSFLKEMILYTYHKVEEPNTEIPPLTEVTNEKLRRFVINFSKLGSIPMRIKWFAEKNIEPRIESCTVVSRNQALKEGEACLVSRNDPMHDSVKYLKNNLKNDTDILQEYYVPRAEFVSFIDEIRTIMQKNKTNLLNASIRVVHKEDNFLNYAPQDAFAVVLYINQTTDKEGNEKMAKLTNELIDATTKHNGRFFLPYQLHYSEAQLVASYPEITQFFEAKKKYDPSLRLTNTFYNKYASSISDLNTTQ
jgi:FAD/FMN-containing dehydrogenase